MTDRWVDTGSAASTMASMSAARRRRVARAVLVVAVSIAVAGSAAPARAAAPSGPPQRYLVRFAAGSDAAAEARSVARDGGRVVHVLEHVFPGAVVDLPPAAVERLAENGRIAAFAADGAVTVADTQPSPPWGLDRVDQRALPLSASYTYGSTGLGVSAYVVDTGIRADHVDFSGRVRSGHTSISDGRGTSDCHGHGTHVAGTVGGETYGVAKDVALVAVRVLDCRGSGTWSGVVAGLDWIAADHPAGAPAVANMSLGGGANSVVDAAVAALVADGVTVAVAAGNSNADACTASPARVPEALTVGATGSNDARASFSNFGTCLDLFAPGVSIVSASASSTTGTATMSGTSMAAPHVAGAVARTLSEEPSLLPGAVASAITTTATAGAVTSAGSGSPNLLLYADPGTTSTDPIDPPTLTAPAPPGTPTATAGKRSATVQWTRTTDDGGSPVTGQTVRVYRGGVLVGTVAVSATTTRVTIKGLEANKPYHFTVTATNAVGTSAESGASNVVYPRR